MWGRDERKCSGWFESLERWRTKKQPCDRLRSDWELLKSVLIQEESNVIFSPSSSEQQQRVSWSLIRHYAWHISSFCSTHKGREAPVEGRCWTRSKRHRLTETWIHIFLTRGQECGGASASLMIYHVRWSLLHPYKHWRTFSLVPDGPPVRKESSAQTGK